MSDGSPASMDATPYAALRRRMGGGPSRYHEDALPGVDADAILTGRTPDAMLRALFRSLYPIGTAHPLIRLGAAADGGYLLPDDLDGITACFSPGVEDRATFEEAMTDRGIPCFLADASVAAAPSDNPLFDFIPKFIGMETRGNTIRLQDWVADKSGQRDGDMILQMDIEGAEYVTLFDTPSEVLRRFRIIVIEFHMLDSLFVRSSFSMMRPVFNKLLRDFLPVHVHPNNCCGIFGIGDLATPMIAEMTFLRRDRVSGVTGPVDLPHPLDVDCVTDHDPIPLPDCWRPA